MSERSAFAPGFDADAEYGVSEFPSGVWEPEVWYFFGRQNSFIVSLHNCQMSTFPPQNCVSKSGRPFTIRTAQPEDAAALLDYIRSVAEETEFFIIEPDEFPDSVEKERGWVIDHLDHPAQIALMAEASGQVIGSLSFESGPYRRISHRGTLGIAVVHQWRGQGVGTALLRTLIDWAMANPLIEKVCLDVFATNTNAIRLYNKLGFVEEGRRPRDVKLGPGRYVDAIAMYRFVY